MSLRLTRRSERSLLLATRKQDIGKWNHAGPAENEVIIPARVEDLRIAFQPWFEGRASLDYEKLRELAKHEEDWITSTEELSAEDPFEIRRAR